MNIIFFILIFEILYNIIKSDTIEKCEVVNYCGNIPCSMHGYCDFDFLGKNVDSLIKSITNNISCKCYPGYSSYDIENLHLKDRTVYCCYEQKSHLTAFYLEFFLGFGIGHFYISNIKSGLIKFFLEFFLYTFLIFMSYFSCKKEHTVIINLKEVNKKENINELSKIDEIKENDEDENINDENKNEKNSELNESFDEEEEKINELLNDNLIKCPKTKFLIIAAFILIGTVRIIDVFLIGFGYYSDKNGEDLEMWC